MANENLPAKQESEIRYTIEGREIVLSPTLVRKYLVRGHGELATGQEIALVMGICRARALDPWAGDVYPIKYTANDPMAIVISIDSVRARARAQQDCEGWDCGIIVQDKDGQVKNSAGLILEGEKLLGGWSECQPKGWSKPMRLEVNLNAYIKKKNDGQITKFWKPEQQPMMISKVAEMQLLRRLWPAALSKLYLHEEIGVSDMGDGMNIDMAPAANGEGVTWEENPDGSKGHPEETILEKFRRLATDSGSADQTELDLFIKASAAATKKTEVEMMTAAWADFPAFLKIFEKSMAKKIQRVKEKAEIDAKTKAAESKKAKAAKNDESPLQDGPFPEVPENIDPETGEFTAGNGDNAQFVKCKEKDDEMTRGYCRTTCVKFKGHPVDCPDYASDSI